MCGLAGFCGHGDRNDLERMTAALAHRGPDGSGHHIDSARRVFLGHRRLAIIDLAGGDQPMWNEDHTVAVVFNGEIYNHAELRAELVRLGHTFASDHSDTEVLVHGYESWGADLPGKLNGMFAFAIFDRSRKELFLARDRFGEKPLYYSLAKGLFAFASELTALAEHAQVDRSIDLRAAQKLFAYGYIPAPLSFLKGSRKLPAGHWLRYELGSSDATVRCYWSFSLETDPGLAQTQESLLVDELEALLVQATRRRLMSDVPLGVFLSGGLDSSLVLASAAKSTPGSDIKTFTVGFKEPSFDESPFARTVARHIGTDHHERILDLDLARDLIPAMLARMDEPLGDPSLLPTFLLSRFTRENVTVALSGDGGDELFAGYDPFVALGPAAHYNYWMPDWAHAGLKRLVGLLTASDRNMSLEFKLKRALQGLSYPEQVWLPAWMAPLDLDDLKALFDTPIEIEDVYSEAITAWNGAGTKAPVDKALEFFTRIYLQDDILTKVDRASMMNSLETRAVFLDNDAVDFCRRLPHTLKFRNGERKYLLKQVARRHLPADITERRKKGFGIPLALWLKQMPAPSALAGGCVNGSWGAAAYNRHVAGQKDYRFFLWSWMASQACERRLGRQREAVA